MAVRFTRDALAVVVTAAFLTWFAATFFIPALLHIYIDPYGWERLAMLDVLAAILSVLGYFAIRARVPA